VAEMRSEILMSRWRAGGRRGIRSATPTAPGRAVEQHRAWTAAIRASMQQVRK
jgi:hypothetical protein